MRSELIQPTEAAEINRFSVRVQGAFDLSRSIGQRDRFISKREAQDINDFARSILRAFEETSATKARPPRPASQS